MSEFATALAEVLESGWASTARPNQLPPAGDWFVWLAIAGRGWGKTRVLSEFVIDNVARGAAKRIALVAATAADARDVMVEGESGILTVSPAWCRPLYEPSKRRLTWPNARSRRRSVLMNQSVCVVHNMILPRLTSSARGEDRRPGTT
jgi:phage terminase large subunit-like protein